jgi:hypothetical protein
MGWKQRLKMQSPLSVVTFVAANRQYSLSDFVSQRLFSHESK